MKPVPTDPKRQHSRFIQAFCDDLLARDSDYPRAKAVCEIARQTQEPREAGVAKNAPASNQ